MEHDKTGILVWPKGALSRSARVGARQSAALG